RVKKRKQLRLGLLVQGVEPITRRLGLAIVRKNGGLDARGASVMQERGYHTQPPEWRRPHLVTSRVPLFDTVAQMAQVMEQEVREWEERLIRQCGDFVRPTLERRDVTVRTSQ